MTLSRALLLIALITSFVFIYAHEQVSKVILLYQIQNHELQKDLLTDAHHRLKYQVSRLSSPSSLEQALTEKKLVLEFPEAREVVRLAMEERPVQESRKKSFFDLISTTKVAEARPR